MGLMQPELTGLGDKSRGLLEEVHEQEAQERRQRQKFSPLTLCLVNKMRAALLLLVVLITITTVAGGKNKKEKNKPSQHGSECTDWRYGNCVPSNGDCGAGFREGSCDQQTKKMKCKIPCNWKKEFGADCKYRFGSWGACDPGSGSRTRTGTLKKAMYNAECQQTITVSKPCLGKTKQKPKERREKARGTRNKV